ncbi:MAG: FliM/FliN family flagellar motor switch protein [Candidatus Melainabacteria bacterium]|jgi:flagellar motor switch protein FliN/FliY
MTSAVQNISHVKSQSVVNALGIKTSSNFGNMVMELSWTDLNLDPGAICREFFGVPVSCKLIAIADELDLSVWHGVSSHWSLWTEETDCQLRMDSSLILNFLKSSLGGKDQDKNFTCPTMTSIEKEVVQEFTQELIDSLNLQLLHQGLNDRYAAWQNTLVHLIWIISFADTKDQGNSPNDSAHQSINNPSIGKIALSLPIRRIATNFNWLTKEPIHSIEDFEDIAIKLDLLVGKTKLTLADLAKLEAEDFILLEQSDRNFLRVLGMDLLTSTQNNFQIPIGLNLNKQTSKKSKHHKKLHIINLDEHSIEEIKQMSSENSDQEEVLSNFPVELRAEFRDVKVTLKEILALQSGSVLSIDRVTNGELFLTSQGKPIAKGELVVAGDKFGILIKEVFLKQE